MILHDADPELLNWIASSLRERAERWQLRGRVVPVVVSEFMTDLVRSGQQTTRVAPFAGPVHDPPVQLIDYATAAQLLGVYVRTVQRRVIAGELVSLTVGRQRRIHVDDLAAYITAQRKAPDA